MKIRYEIIIILTLLLILCATTGCFSSGRPVDYSQVARLMDDAGGEIKGIDLSIMDNQAVADMRSNISRSDAYLAAAEALLNTTSPVSTADQVSIQNTKKLINGFQEYNQALYDISNLLEKIIKISEFSKKQQWANAKKGIDDAWLDYNGTINHISRARELLISVDATSIPIEVKNSEKYLYLSYGSGASYREEMFNYWDQFATFDYMLLGLRELIEGVEDYQNGKTVQAKIHFWRSHDYLALGELYGGEDIRKDYRDMRLEVYNLLNMRIFSNVQVVDSVYIEDPEYPGTFADLHMIAQRLRE